MSYRGEEHFRNQTLREDVYLRRHATGLPVYFCPKPGFRKRYACFATNFGSTDSSFRRAGGERVDVPDGSAHFLEHKLFEGEDGNAFEKFSKYGASSNAYTSFTVTNYLFSCGTDFFPNLELLVSFVLDPWFTDENVEKEKGIIGQEIRMYDDDPGWRIYMNLLAGLYSKHPIRIDIAGTVESIGTITKESLYRCYETFYHPENMILFAIGDEDRDRFFDAVDRSLERARRAPLGRVDRIVPEEPPAIARPRTEAAMEVSMPRVLVGFKDLDVGYDGRRLLERELATEILLEILFGKASSFYSRLYEERLIDESFDSSYSGQVAVGHSIVGGETPDPERLAQEIAREVERAGREGIAREDFDRQKRAVMGSFFRHFKSLEVIANNYCAYRFQGIDLFDLIDVLHALGVDRLDRRLRDHLSPERMSLSIVRPTQKPAGAP